MGEKQQPNMEVLLVVGKKIPDQIKDITMSELWAELKPLVPAGDTLFFDPVPFKSAKKGRQTLSQLYKLKYGKAVNERACRSTVKWAQEHGELLITSIAGVRYATSKDEYHDWARTQLRHAFSILRFWRNVAPGIVQELEGQMDATKDQDPAGE